MSWKDRLREASFRGIQFYVESADHATGRDTVVHKFANRKIPYTEDVNKAPETWNIEAYLIGKDYLERRDSLLDAVNQEGPGELIHPYYGSLFVQVGNVTISYSSREGGMCRFSIPFTEKGEVLYPSSIKDGQASLLGSAERVIADSKSAFDAAYSLISAPGHIVDGARAAVKSATEKFKEGTKLITATADAAANFAYSMKGLQNDVNSLAAAPSKLSERLQYSIGLVSELAEDPKQRSVALRAVAQFENNVVVQFETPSREQESVNNDQIVDLVVLTALAYESISLSEQSYSTEVEAAAALSDIEERIRFQLDKCKNDDLFQSLSDLLADLSGLLLDQSIYYRKVISFDSNNCLPAIVHLYDLVGGIDDEQDFLARNNVSHPGFVYPGKLEVASA
jgi:prophage DNA circulation protein